ncbi:MAG: pilus assembly protein [Alphaproteobacteria bacterium]|nr:pilus assembly protein [Alphaproteobacteria bacterium]
MIRLLGNLLRNREGVAATEFALIAPVFALFLAGVFDYGMYINTNMRMENTARSAAEYVIQGGDSGLISDDVITQS